MRAPLLSTSLVLFWAPAFWASGAFGQQVDDRAAAAPNCQESPAPEGADEDDDQAIDDLTEMIRLDPEDSNLYANRAYRWHRKGDFDKAIADLTEAIRLDPKVPDSYYNRGCAWGAKND